jgi:predicted ester cyclase
MLKSKLMTVAALAILAVGSIGAISNAVADEALNEEIIVRNTDELWHSGKYSFIDKYVSKDYIRHMPGGVKFVGRDGYREHVSGFRKSVPDYYASMDILVADGDYVVVRYLGGGTHTGKGGAFGEPTGDKVAFTAMVIHRLSGGMMVEDWLEFSMVDCAVSTLAACK